MKKLLKKLKAILLSTIATRFYWMILDGALAGAIVYFTDISAWYGVPLVAILQGITKEINNRYLQN